MSELFPERLAVTHNGTTWPLPRDSAMVAPGVGQYGAYAQYAAEHCRLLLYHSRAEKRLILLLPKGHVQFFKGADIKQFLNGYRACLNAQPEPKADPPAE